MRRALAWLFTLTLIGFGLLWPLVFGGGDDERADAPDPVVITDYQAEFQVDADGRLHAVETITADFPSGRHGIFRHWDVANQNNPRLRQEPDITSVRLDGRPAPYQLQWAGDKRFRVARIGDPDVTLDWGSHVFEIRYTIPGVLDPGSVGADKQFAESTGDPNSRSVFYWNVIAPAWNNTIERAEISVTLPADITGAECSVGTGVGRACRDLAVSGNTVRMQALDLGPHTPVTLRAGVDVTTPPQVSLPWPHTWDRILGRSLTAVLWVAGLSVALGLLAYFWSRTTSEPTPGFPLQYGPPDGLGPVQTEYIRTESVPKNGLTATLLYLAERRLVELRQVSDKQWNVRGLAEPGAWADVDPVSVAVGSALKVMQPGAEFAAKRTVKSGQKLSRAKTDMTAAVKKWAFDGGLLVNRRKELWVRTANAFAFFAALGGFWLWFGIPVTMWGLPFAVFFVLSVGSWQDGVGTRRTLAGRDLWSRVGGFHRLLSTDSAETRFDFAARKDLYLAYVPFAVAAGTAALWAKKYHDSIGTPAPQPDWYSSTSQSSWDSTGGGGGDGRDSGVDRDPDTGGVGPHRFRGGAQQASRR
ncbi:DUF2207 domain-containing protein [Mycolicibacterium wolinskyi]|uniref:DUF2207 domain-containing protein n=1 Tax=Mycolicibacterium wolinskyi TaxID=59750 RepID=UPI000A16B89E|nr:DUF2207 domain-containing protein [Mycolicibacterium wolinskyi]